jgi:hypothetical protein
MEFNALDAANQIIRELMGGYAPQPVEATVAEGKLELAMLNLKIATAKLKLSTEKLKEFLDGGL